MMLRMASGIATQLPVTFLRGGSLNRSLFSKQKEQKIEHSNELNQSGTNLWIILYAGSSLSC